MEPEPDVTQAAAHSNSKNYKLGAAASAIEGSQLDKTKTPYKGLNPYSEDDAELFFGRKRDTQRIVNNLFAWRLTVLYGESGVGKSSVLRAGVIHALQKEAQENIEDYGFPKLAVVIFPPLQGERIWQQNPLESLIQQIEEDMGQTGFEMQPPEPGLSFVETLQVWTKQLGRENLDGRLFIILDQFEEYFQYHPEEEKEGGFIAEVSKAVNHPDLKVNFLISLREDSYAKLNRLRGYLPDILDICLHIEHLKKEDADDAITQPVEKYNQAKPKQSVKISRDLVKALLKGIPQVERGGDGRAGIEQLKPILENQILAPYLQLVMTRLWKEMKDAKSYCLNLQTLTKLADRDTKDDDEKVTSAIKNIVQKHVTNAMNSLPTTNMKDIAARSLKYLVTPSGTKYAYCVADLASLVGCHPKKLDYLLKELAKDQRIIRSVGPSPNKPEVKQYEIFHDFLAQPLLDWRRQYIKKTETDKIIRNWWSSIGSLLIIGLFFFSFIVEQKDQKKQQVMQEMSEQAVNGNSQLDMLIAALKTEKMKTLARENDISFRVRYKDFLDKLDEKLNYALQNSLEDIREQNKFEREREAVWNLNFNIDQPLSSYEYLNYATISADGTARLWDLEGNQLAVFKGHTQAIWNISFSQDGTRLATASADGTARLWDLEGNQLAVFDRHRLSNKVNKSSQIPPVRSVSFNSDGTRLATAYADGTALLWDLEGNQLAVFKGHTQAIWNISFSQDGTRLATASADGTARLWDLEGNQLDVFDRHRLSNKVNKSSQIPSVRSVSFNSDGTRLATAYADGTALLWDLEGNQPPVEFRGHEGEVWSISFNSDGTRLATASADGTARLWDLENNQPPVEFKGHRDKVWSAKFSSDDQKLITASKDGTIRFWKLQKSDKKNQQERSKQLEELVKDGCDWLQEYREYYHSREKENLPCSDTEVKE